MLQETLPTDSKSIGFHVRGTEISRLEAFSDVMFGFALTLIVVSLEVPRTFDDLMQALSNFPSFAACFCILMWVWHEHYKFFRHYALQDRRTIILNSILLFVVLFYIYPLKFLTTVKVNVPNHGIAYEQTGPLLLVVSAGFAMVFLVFMLLYMHAYKQREHLGLHQFEIFDTRTRIFFHGINAVAGAFAGIAALAFPTKWVIISAIISYVIFMPFANFFCMRHRNKIRRELVVS